MEQVILDQIMKLSRKMGEMNAELCAKIDAQGKKIDALSKKIDVQDKKFDAQDKKIDAQDKKIDALGKRMDVGFKKQAEDTARIERIIKEEAKDTAEIFHDIFRNLGENERKIVSLYK